jgi:hypothetical protein
MAPADGLFLRVFALSTVARRVLRSSAQAAAGAAARVPLDARKIAGVWRGTRRAVVPATAAPIFMRRHFVASAIILNLISTGVSPCVASLFAAPITGHSCCPLRMTEAAPAATPSGIAVAAADCCVNAPEPLAPSTVPAAGTSTSKAVASNHDVANADASIISAPLVPTLHSRVVDPRARSAPRPPLVTVLLI